MKILKIGAVWCAGCLVMKPRWAEIEKEMPALVTEYYDYDQSPQIVEKYKIDEKLPTFIFLDSNNSEILRLSGEVEKNKLITLINENINK